MEKYFPGTGTEDYASSFYKEKERIQNSDIMNKIIADYPGDTKSQMAALNKLAEGSIKTGGRALMGGMSFKDML